MNSQSNHIQHLKHLLNNLLLLTEGLKRSFPPLGLCKEIMDSPCPLITLIKNQKKMKSWTHPVSSFALLTSGKKTETTNTQ